MQNQSVIQPGSSCCRCKEPDCIKAATRNSEYCRKHNDKHRQQETQNARQVRHRLGIRRDVMRAGGRIAPFFGALGELPDSPGARKYAVWERQLELDGLLAKEGPATFDIRQAISVPSRAIRLHYLVEKPKNRDELHQYIHALKIIVDVGVDDLRVLPFLRDCSAEVLAFHLRSGNVCQLAMAAMRHGNVERLLGSERKCRDVMKQALHLLGESLEPWTTRRAVLYHNALFHYLRFFGADWDWDDQQKMMKEIIQRARDLHAHGARLETFREAARHFGSHGERDLALKYHAYLEELLKKHRFPQYGLPCLLRPKIHALLATKDSKDKENAIEAVLQYRTMYLSDRHCYYERQLLNWKRELGLGYDVPPSTYGAMTFTYLPRDNPDAA